MAVDDTPPTDTRFAAGLTAVCRWFAVAGGLVLAAAAVLTVVSVVGRGLFGVPVPGDFELVELGCGIAVFAFLPYCHLTNGNVAVDFLVVRMPPAVGRLMAVAGHVLLAVIALVLAHRLAAGGLDMWRAADETMVLQVPRWWAFPPIVLASLLLVVVCCHGAIRVVRESRAR